MGRNKTLSAAAVLCMSVGAIAATPSAATASSADEYLGMLNSERTARGLPALAERSDLDAIAASWSAHMASTGTLQHNPQLANVVHNWQAVGENVGEGPTISDLDSAFMASAEHRANILDPTYRDVGVGVATSGGVLWITVDFREPERVTTSIPDSQQTARRLPSSTVSGRSAASGIVLLQQGDVGRAVARIQARLDLRADGVYGAKTRRAVIWFQRRHRLRVDGVVGPETMAALHRSTVRHGHPAVQQRLQPCDEPGAVAACTAS